MEDKFSKLSETLDRFSATLESHSKREKVTKTEKKIKELEAGMVEMENRSRRDNIRILNLKEGREGNQPLQFFESWLPTLLGLDANPAIKSRIKIDRAHRGLGPRNARPRPVIINLHNSRDKSWILTALRKKPTLEHDGQRIYIQQDLSAAARQWHLNSLLLSNPAFISYLEAEWKLYISKNDTSDTSASILWEAGKAFMRGSIISYTAARKIIVLSKQLDLEQQIKNLDRELKMSFSTTAFKKLEAARSLTNSKG
uniref:Uncharacterized protein n=1 Tax=Oryzias latipes TaxID=8090 RepID=A0A3P9HGA3_ORYLA